MPSELSGIVVVDKPKRMSSAGVVARIKAITGAKKVGHTGTLDPFATGVLVCCLNRATRLARFFLEGSKVYEAQLVLGIVTDTQDATGTILQRHALDGITVDRIREAASQFVGQIQQVPPIYSALKHRGIPLYKLARRGAAVQKPSRPVRIDHLQILDVNLPEVRLSVACSSGTYIRTLSADIGHELGCGGHLAELRRTASCGFSLNQAVNLEDLQAFRDRGSLEETVIPMHAALSFMPAAGVDDALAKKIQNGMKVSPADFPVRPQVSDQGLFKVLNTRGHLIAVLGESGASPNYNYCCVFSA